MPVPFQGLKGMLRNSLPTASAVLFPVSPDGAVCVCLWLFIPLNTHSYFKDKWDTTVSKTEYFS